MALVPGLVALFHLPSTLLQGSIGFPGFPGANGEKGGRVRTVVAWYVGVGPLVNALLILLHLLSDALFRSN